jgi:pimeloyl-ACP methyl ester carboxylesterase
MELRRINGSKIAIDVRGQGDPVLFIHGALGQIQMWAEPMEALSATRRVIAYDLRGHGKSPPPATPDCDVHVGDAAAVLTDKAGDTPATVVGWSNGASIALTLALGHPALVQGLILIEPPFHWLRPPSVGLLKALVGVRLQLLRGRDRVAAEKFMRWIMARSSGGTSWDEAPKAVRELMLSDVDAWKAEARPHRRDMFLTHISARAMGACSVPITYLLGDDSNPLFHRAHKTLVDALPSIRTIRVPGATHMLPFQAPRAIVEAVLARDGADCR